MSDQKTEVRSQKPAVNCGNCRHWRADVLPGSRTPKAAWGNCFVEFGPELTIAGRITTDLTTCSAHEFAPEAKP